MAATLLLVASVGITMFLFIFILKKTGDVSLNAAFCSLLEFGTNELPDFCTGAAAR